MDAPAPGPYPPPRPREDPAPFPDTLTVNLNLAVSGDLALRHYYPPSAPLPAATLITTTFAGVTTRTRTARMAYILPDAKRVTVKIDYLDAAGNPAVVDGVVTWASSDANIARVTADTNDSTRAVIDGMEIGSAQVNATADADLGEGTRNLVTLFDVQVVGGEAVTGTISPVGEPIDTPEVTPHGKK